MDCDTGCRAEQGQQQPRLEACLKWALKLLESTFHCSHKHLRIASTCPDRLSCEFLLAVAGGDREASGPHTPPLGVLCQCTPPASTASSQNHTLLCFSPGPWSLHTLAWPLSWSGSVGLSSGPSWLGCCLKFYRYRIRYKPGPEEVP